MSAHAQANADQLLVLVERLTEALAADARAFEQRRPNEAAARMDETARLANLYRHESARLRADPSLIAGCAEATRMRLIRATEAFDAVLARHARALQAAKTVTEGVVRAIADEVARGRSTGAAYGPGARAQQAPATAVTLNRKA
ncbi:MAG TPA: flagellar basal body protein [Caulobacteraceae bacterium]|jgi:hypothetical protein